MFDNSQKERVMNVFFFLTKDLWSVCQMHFPIRISGYFFTFYIVWIFHTWNFKLNTTSEWMFVTCRENSKNKKSHWTLLLSMKRAAYRSGNIFVSNQKQLKEIILNIVSFSCSFFIHLMHIYRYWDWIFLQQQLSTISCKFLCYSYVCVRLH